MILGSNFYLAAETAEPSGIGAFNINLKSFIFQLVTFILVLLVFKRWILPPILKTLEERQKTVEQSLTQAKETEAALARAEAKAEEILAKARSRGDEIIKEAKVSADGVITDAEATAAQRAAAIVKEAEARLEQERAKLKEELKDELADLVADTTEIIIRQKLDAASDRQLIDRAIREAVR